MPTTESPTNAPEFTVSELSFALKRTIEDAYGNVRVRGEISGYRGPHTSGHAYFSLKDESAKIDAVVWRGVFSKLRFKPEEGLEVVAVGKLTTFPGKSAYQIVIESLEPAGAGALMMLLEERRKKLAAEGLFDAARKQLLPSMPRVVGVVTSPTGAVIRDILHRLADRFPVHVLVWPVRVQGETSAAEVAAAIRGFNALDPDGPIPRPDVLVVARGGGSLEDLWSFNEEIVVRAAAASEIPIVSAVGHETDTTLIDFAADVRAPTPTAAAEMVVSVRAELLDAVEATGLRLARAAARGLDVRKREFGALARALPKAEALLALPRQRLDSAAQRLPRALTAELRAKRLAFARVSAGISPATIRAGVTRAGDRLTTLRGRLDTALAGRVAGARLRFEGVGARLAPSLLARPIARLAERLDGLGEGTRRAHTNTLKQRADRLAAVATLLRTLSYRSVLDRGFALVRGPDGAAIRSSSALDAGDRLAIEFADGRIGAVVEGGGPQPSSFARAAPKPRAKAKPAAAAGQDDLFS